MTEKLRPCPFCCGEAKLIREDLFGRLVRYVVECTGCGVKMFSPVAYITDEIALENRKEEVVNKWNRSAIATEEKLWQEKQCTEKIGK